LGGGLGLDPGLDDLAAFCTVDSEGFLMGWWDGAPIAVVCYGPYYRFLGFCIVRPYQGGAGAGMAVWDAGMVHLATRQLGWTACQTSRRITENQAS